MTVVVPFVVEVEVSVTVAITGGREVGRGVGVLAVAIVRKGAGATVAIARGGVQAEVTVVITEGVHAETTAIVIAGEATVARGHEATVVIIGGVEAEATALEGRATTVIIITLIVIMGGCTKVRVTPPLIGHPIVIRVKKYRGMEGSM